MSSRWVKRSTGVLLASAILAGLVVAVASGRSARVVQLQLHGTIVLSGSKIQCGSGQLKGLTYVDCGVADANGQPKRGGYVSLMAADGRVNIVATSTLKTVFSRVPAVSIRRSAAIVVKAGDSIALPKTSISCYASKVGAVPTIFCNYVDAKGNARPRSYAFGISGSIVTTQGWDAKGHVHLIRSWPENG